MKRILLLFAGMLFMFSCEYLNSPTTINKEITTDYLLNGNLDTYIQSDKIFKHTGKPGNETITIGNNDLSKYEDCFVLHVETGTTQGTIVSSALIKLDDMIVLNTSDFSKNVGQNTFEVCNITPTSVMTIEVRGEPESYIEIWIEGKLKEETVTDCDGNIYKTLKIGENIWMSENLKTTKYNDCTDIPLIRFSDGIDWGSIDYPAYCYYNDDLSNVNKYGLLYSGRVVTTGKLCPTGWHVPSLDEWNTLLNDLVTPNNSIETVATLLKATTGWPEGCNGNNLSGFSALPGGMRHKWGLDFRNGGDLGYWYTSTVPTESMYGSNSLYTKFIDCSTAVHEWNGNVVHIQYGFSVRCIKD